MPGKGRHSILRKKDQEKFKVNLEQLNIIMQKEFHSTLLHEQQSVESASMPFFFPVYYSIHRLFHILLLMWKYAEVA